MDYIQQDTEHPVYSTEQIREIEYIAMNQQGIAGFDLMKQAGQSAFSAMCKHFPHAKKIIVVTGIGNNAGDGYIVARLALDAGLLCQVMPLGKIDSLKGDAAQAQQYFMSHEESTEVTTEHDLTQYDLIVDAILGIGLKRPLNGLFANIIDQINACTMPVLSLDVPSGLNADTGKIFAHAVQAELCVTFIGLKSGLLTGLARDHINHLVLAPLSIDSKTLNKVKNLGSTIADSIRNKFLPQRKATSYKGTFGHVLVIGGNRGYPNAARLAGEAAARVGAGLVSVITHPDSVSPIASGCASLMVTGSEDTHALNDLLKQATTIIIGPGLGRDAWAKKMFARVIGCKLPTIIDADALHWLSQNPGIHPHSILTPHSGEAAKLLSCAKIDIESDRLSAVLAINEQYQGVTVLKGAGTLICHDRQLRFCTGGNASLATGGTGDVLSGIIGGLVAQGIPLADAAACGVHIHAKASELISNQGTRGKLASDLFSQLHVLVNPCHAS